MKGLGLNWAMAADDVVTVLKYINIICLLLDGGRKRMATSSPAPDSSSLKHVSSQKI